MPLSVELLKDWFYVLAMGLPRIIALFVMLPIFNKRLLGGAMVRNGICMCLIIFLHPLLTSFHPEEPITIFYTFFIIAKEVFIGIIIGFVISIPFWGLESAGFFIDNQRGASMASTLNPFSGSETSPLGMLYTQAFIALIMSSGLFLLLLQNIFFSYQVWPVFSYFPQFNQEAIIFFLNQFDLIVKLAMWLAAPVIIAMFITEFGVALISRSAPQLNVFILAMPIKSGVAAAILVIYTATMLKLSQQNMSEMGQLFKTVGALWQ